MEYIVQFAFVAFLLAAPGVSAQQVIGRFYPEKERYLVGEPIIVNFEVVNSTDQVAELGTGGCPDPKQFEVDGASAGWHEGWYTCAPQGFAGSCFGGSLEIPAGGKYLRRILLDGPFRIDFPGIYNLRARREQEIRRKGAETVLTYLKVESTFTLSVQTPTEGELEAAYRPFFSDLSGRDLEAKSFAASAITQNPPPFAEPAILALANDQQLSMASVKGLERLATPTARAKLIQMSSITSPDYIRQAAIDALGEIQNSEDCGAMLDIATQNVYFTEGEAYIAAGRICKEEAVPSLQQLLPTANSDLLMYLAIAFENTVSSKAVPTLINLLISSSDVVRRNAEAALSTLTHRKSQYGVADADSARRSFNEWSKWWAANGGSTNIYGPDVCTEPQHLY